MPPKKKAGKSGGDSEAKESKGGGTSTVKVRHILCEKQALFLFLILQFNIFLV
jgi:hypothetical protein